MDSGSFTYNPYQSKGLESDYSQTSGNSKRQKLSYGNTSDFESWSFPKSNGPATLLSDRSSLLNTAAPTLQSTSYQTQPRYTTNDSSSNQLSLSLNSSLFSHAPDLPSYQDNNSYGLGFSMPGVSSSMLPLNSHRAFTDRAFFRDGFSKMASLQLLGDVSNR